MSQDDQDLIYAQVVRDLKAVTREVGSLNVVLDNYAEHFHTVSAALRECVEPDSPQHKIHEAMHALEAAPDKANVLARLVELDAKRRDQDRLELHRSNTEPV